MPVPIPTSLVQPKRQSHGERATQQIREAIVDGTFAPGERLVVQELEEWLGCSRTPIRTALNELVHEGLVEVTPQRITRVLDPMRLDRAEIAEALQVLVGGIARVALPRLDDAARATLATDLGEDSPVVLSILVAGLCPAIPNERLSDTRTQASTLARLFASEPHRSGFNVTALAAAVRTGDVPSLLEELDLALSR